MTSQQVLVWLPLVACAVAFAILVAVSREVELDVVIRLLPGPVAFGATIVLAVRLLPRRGAAFVVVAVVTFAANWVSGAILLDYHPVEAIMVAATIAVLLAFAGELIVDGERKRQVAAPTPQPPA